MLYDTTLIRRLASSWQEETPNEIRQKKHPFATNKDPWTEKRICNIALFLGRNGVEIKKANIDRLSILCSVAVKEGRSHRNRTLLFVGLCAAIGWATIAIATLLPAIVLPILLLTPIAPFATALPLDPSMSMTLAAILFLMSLALTVLVIVRTTYQNSEINALLRDLQTASCNWKNCKIAYGQQVKQLSEKQVSNATSKLFLNIPQIVSVSKDWNSRLGFMKRAGLLVAPDSNNAQPFSRISEFPGFLKSRGIGASPADIDLLIELCDAAMARTERVGSFFIAFTISILSCLVFELVKPTCDDPFRPLICSVLAGLTAFIAFLALSLPQREKIRLQRFKADLTAAKANGTIR